MKKTLLHALFLLSFSLSAQKTIIYGTVTDSKNEPVSFAQVVICEDAEGKKLTRNGVRADINGNFRITTELYGIYFIMAKYVGKPQIIKKIDLKYDSIKLNFQLENPYRSDENVIVQHRCYYRSKRILKPEVKIPFDVSLQKIENQELYLTANDKISKIEIYNLAGNLLKEKSIDEVAVEQPSINIEGISAPLILVKSFDFKGNFRTVKVELH
jgi:hypothetical protein